MIQSKMIMSERSNPWGKLPQADELTLQSKSANPQPSWLLPRGYRCDAHSYPLDDS
jgi:hypothetical protein